MEIAGTNMKRVAILLVKNLAEALQQRCIRTAENEPYWLTPNQYREHDGGVDFIPEKAGDLVAYADSKNLYPLGLVIVREDSRLCEYLNDGPIPLADREFALQLFRFHAHLWFCVIPSLTDSEAEN
ncbi:MAG: hypothetical protein ABR866_01775 [Candidatus Korobacteraceae bacterium]|jgi:hypothetical protein